MQTKADRLIRIDSLEKDTLKPIVKLLLAVGGLFLIWGLVTNLPGIETVIPRTAVTFGALLGGLVTLAIVAVLAYVAFKIEPVLERALTGPADVVSDVASMAKHVVLFVAIVTAHGGFAPLAVPSLASVDLVWTYDLLFLALALVPTVVIAVLLVRNLDAIATLLTSRLSSDEADDRTGDDGTRRGDTASPDDTTRHDGDVDRIDAAGDGSDSTTTD